MLKPSSPMISAIALDCRLLLEDHVLKHLPRILLVTPDSGGADIFMVLALDHPVDLQDGVELVKHRVDGLEKVRVFGAKDLQLACLVFGHLVSPLAQPFLMGGLALL